MQDAVVARQYISDRATFEATARMWTGAHDCCLCAGGGLFSEHMCGAENFAHRSQAGGEDEKVLRLADMGFSKEAAGVALDTAHGDENAALELLLAAV